MIENVIVNWYIFCIYLQLRCTRSFTDNTFNCFLSSCWCSCGGWTWALTGRRWWTFCLISPDIPRLWTLCASAPMESCWPQEEMVGLTLYTDTRSNLYYDVFLAHLEGTVILKSEQIISNQWPFSNSRVIFVFLCCYRCSDSAVEAQWL